jgi:hypothetical protein
MAQHDYNIANQSGAAFRQDLNNALEAIVSQNSGTAEPSTTFAYQWWADTTAGVLKQRNAANSAWITIRELDGDMVLQAGAEATPSLYFDGDTNTGVFSPGADQVAVATGGVSRLVVNASGQAALGAGSVGAPVITTTGDTDTGVYFPAADTIGMATGGTERLLLNSTGALLVQGVYDGTTATAANVNVTTNGSMRRSTSSIKYKTDVETIQDQYADALLECRPVWYRSTCDGDRPEHSWWGFIAEEVAEIDPRLVQWKTTEAVVQENGSLEHVPCDPEPEGVSYDRFVPHLLNLIKRQKEQIEAMEARLSSLESQ